MSESKRKSVEKHVTLEEPEGWKALEGMTAVTVCRCGNRAGVSSGGVLESQGTLEKTTITSIQTQDRI